MTTQLQALRQYTTVVADTGDLDAIRQYQPTDATTNPTLILKAAQSDLGRPLVERVLRDAPDASVREQIQQLLVAFGCAILEIIPGRVSTEVDARHSFDVRITLELARDLIARYERAGIDRERVLIKIAATWEGIAAARVLQSEGIRCNLTLLFSAAQAMACADAKVQLISPFVGRIYDWHRKQQGSAWDDAANAGANDPGVRSVRAIYEAYRRHGIATEIMGASFRNTGQVLALAGCDLLTISPALLADLEAAPGQVERALRSSADPVVPAPAPANEAEFRFALNEDAMAQDKLAEGIRLFAADARKLEALLQAR
ncbi:MAG: transaldolase [Pigmentiphaga sp.]